MAISGIYTRHPASVPSHSQRWIGGRVWTSWLHSIGASRVNRTRSHGPWDAQPSALPFLTSCLSVYGYPEAISDSSVCVIRRAVDADARAAVCRVKRSGRALPCYETYRGLRIYTWLPCVLSTSLPMSPVFISSLHRDPTPPSPTVPTVPLMTEAARRLVMEASGRTEYISPIPRAQSTVSFRTPSPIETMDGSDDEGMPPSSQLRPARWIFPETPPISPTPVAREWSMEQYICFVYRNDPVSNCSWRIPSVLISVRYGSASPLSWKSLVGGG